jgi:hypothetical protein
VVAQYAGDVSYAASTSAAITLTGSGVAAPVIGSISPTSVAAGSAGGTLTVNGTGFASGAQVKWNGAALTTAFVSATKLTATYTATQVASVGSVAITVLSGGQTSNAATLTITGSTAAPAITSLSPSSATAGGAAFTLTVNGTNFASGAQVKWNGSARTTTFASATKVTAAIAAADIATAGTAAVTVTVGSGTSNPVSFPIAAASAKPVPSAVTPNFAVVGSAATTVTIAGTGFASGSVVSFNVTKLATTYVSATKLTAVIPAASLTTLGTQAITVANGTAVSATSLAFTVGPAAHTPLAYGYFSAAAKVGASSGNIACTWDKTDSEYLCTVTGEHFFYQNYVVNVTLADSEALAFVSVNSMGGEQILVKFHNPEGASIQEPFYITVFKP